jgi:hypothetical protein
LRRYHLDDADDADAGRNQTITMRPSLKNSAPVAVFAFVMVSFGAT